MLAKQKRDSDQKNESRNFFSAAVKQYLSSLDRKEGAVLPSAAR